MKNIIKNFIEVINIIVFDFLKPLTIGLYERAVNIIFTVATSMLNLAFDILYILNPAFFTNEIEQDNNNRKNKIGF